MFSATCYHKRSGFGTVHLPWDVIFVTRFLNRESIILRRNKEYLHEKVVV